MLNKKYKRLFFSTMCVSFFATGCGHTVEEEISFDSQEIIDDNIITISAVGDVMVHTAQLEAQRKDDGTYNFDNNFKYIKEIISNTDLSIANLETTINPERNYSGYPSFNSPPSLIKTLKNTGFDIVSTINNHTLDTSYSGMISTLNEIQKLGLKTVGTKLDVNEKNYIIEDVEGIKIGIASFSYGDIVNGKKYLNGITSSQSNDLMNVISGNNPEKAFETIKKELDLMKEDGVDFTILCLHWGIEYDQSPNSYQKELAQLLSNEGVDLILGSHPHVVQPIEYIKSQIDDSHECLVVYSMGNIISNQREEEMGFDKSENGIIPIFELEKSDDGTVSLKTAKYIATWVDKYKTNDRNIYEIIPITTDVNILSQRVHASSDELQNSLNNTTSLMTDNRVSLYLQD